MSKLISFKIEEGLYKGLIYEEEDLYEHVRLRLLNNMSRNKTNYDFSKVDESYVMLDRKQNHSFFDLVIFVDDHFNIKQIKNTYSFNEDQISEILFSQI